MLIFFSHQLHFMSFKIRKFSVIRTDENIQTRRRFHQILFFLISCHKKTISMMSLGWGNDNWCVFQIWSTHNTAWTHTSTIWFTTSTGKWKHLKLFRSYPTINQSGILVSFTAVITIKLKNCTSFSIECWVFKETLYNFNIIIVLFLWFFSSGCIWMKFSVVHLARLLGQRVQSAGLCNPLF